MNTNVKNVRKNFHFSYQSQIMNEKNLLLVLTAKVKVRGEFFQTSLQLHLRRADCSKKMLGIEL